MWLMLRQLHRPCCVNDTYCLAGIIQMYTVRASICGHGACRAEEQLSVSTCETEVNPDCFWTGLQVRTGSGLPGTGLGAVEGFSYLSLVALVLAFGSEYLQKGSLPGVTG